MGWVCWFLSMSFFLYIVYELLVGLAAATASDADPQIAKKIHTAQVMTVISWCTYPIVYLFPMFGFSAAKAVVSIKWAIAFQTSSPNAESAWLSTRSPTPSLARKPCCNDLAEYATRFHL